VHAHKLPSAEAQGKNPPSFRRVSVKLTIRSPLLRAPQFFHTLSLSLSSSFSFIALDRRFRSLSVPLAVHHYAASLIQAALLANGV
jgi:hypothetical protein